MIDAELDERMLNYAAMEMQHIYDKYLKNSAGKIYFSVIPDKNYYLAEANGYPAMDYDKMISYICDKTSYMEYIDIFDTLSIDDYYRTDSHWRQECLSDTVMQLADEMGVGTFAEYETKILDVPFYGSYSDDYSGSVEPDTVQYMTNDVLEQCIVTSYSTGAEMPAALYDFEKAKTRPYDLFLAGTQAIITIENPKATTDKELVLFRDSFGSSIAPLLMNGYKKITLVDVRYILSDALGEYIDFEDQDVLFLYSTTLLNNSTSMK